MTGGQGLARVGLAALSKEPLGDLVSMCVTCVTRRREHLALGCHPGPARRGLGW